MRVGWSTPPSDELAEMESFRLKFTIDGSTTLIEETDLTKTALNITLSSAVLFGYVTNSNLQVAVNHVYKDGTTSATVLGTELASLIMTPGIPQFSGVLTNYMLSSEYTLIYKSNIQISNNQTVTPVEQSLQIYNNSTLLWEAATLGNSSNVNTYNVTMSKVPDLIYMFRLEMANAFGGSYSYTNVTGCTKVSKRFQRMFLSFLVKLTLHSKQLNDIFGLLIDAETKFTFFDIAKGRSNIQKETQSLPKSCTQRIVSGREVEVRSKPIQYLLCNMLMCRLRSYQKAILGSILILQLLPSVIDTVCFKQRYSTMRRMNTRLVTIRINLQVFLMTTTADLSMGHTTVVKRIIHSR